MANYLYTGLNERMESTLDKIQTKRIIVQPQKCARGNVKCESVNENQSRGNGGATARANDITGINRSCRG